MKRLSLIATSLLLLGSTAFAKEKLNVLYVGGSPDIETMGVAYDTVYAEKSVKTRMADFTKFLKSHFTKVTSVEGKNYSPEMSDAYDVTVFDGHPKEITPKIMERDENGRVIRYEKASYLPADFDNACVMIAQMSEDLGRSIGTKNDWMCLCLDNYALGWDKNHQIFKGPFKVDIKSEMRPTPASAKEYEPIYGYKLPDETEMWLIHRPVTPQNYGRIGMVSRPGGYLDSPDTEVISGGQCAKSIDAVAIGRHGNFFHWGFAAKPSDMTPSAREALANAIVYMKDFNGKKILAKKFNENIATRKDALANKYFASKACCDANNEVNYRFYTVMDSIHKSIERKKAAGEKLDGTEAFYADIPAPQKPVPVTYSDYIKSRYPDLYPVFGEDEAEYARYFDINTPYFIPDEKGYNLVIDQDARSLKIANNDIRLLDKAIELLEAGGNDAEKGRRILERYTLCRFATPAEWKGWLAKNRDKMFFTESGGWLWLVNTDDPNEFGNDYSTLKKEKETRQSKEANQGKNELSSTLKTDEDNPVAFETIIEELSNGLKDVVITMTVHEGYHTYAMLDEEDPFIPTEITIELPEGYKKIGDLVLPQQSPSSTKTTYYTGTGQFRQKIAGTGTGKLTCKVHYQVCNESSCKMPTTKTMEIEL